jgi:cephalosporin hydroxylase
VLDLLGAGVVCTVDIEALTNRPAHPRIRYVSGSSVAPEVVSELEAVADSAQRVMVILDSDHQCEHVAKELAAYAPMVTPGCYLIIEDTNVNGHPVVPEYGPGPAEALHQFLVEDERFEVDSSREKLLFTFNPGGFLRRRPS